MTGERSERTNWPHDAPGPIELVEAVRDYLADDLGPRATGRDRWMSKVAANALTVALREIRSADADAERHLARLASLGVADDRQLAEAIRTGRFDERRSDLLSALWETTIDKLVVSNPDYRQRCSEPG